MTTRAEYEPILQGKDAVTNVIIAHFCEQGWQCDDILKNVATKIYSPHRALVRVTFDSDNQQYWVNGEYESKGENVLAIRFACIKKTFSQAEIVDALEAFIIEVESSINQSYAVRFLGDNKPLVRGNKPLPQWNW